MIDKIKLYWLLSNLYELIHIWEDTVRKNNHYCHTLNHLKKKFTPEREGREGEEREKGWKEGRTEGEKGREGKEELLRKMKQGRQWGEGGDSDISNLNGRLWSCLHLAHDVSMYHWTIPSAVSAENTLSHDVSMYHWMIPSAVSAENTLWQGSWSPAPTQAIGLINILKSIVSGPAFPNFWITDLPLPTIRSSLFDQVCLRMTTEESSEHKHFLKLAVGTCTHTPLVTLVSIHSHTHTKCTLPQQSCTHLTL